MLNNEWHGLIKVLEVKHVRNGRVIWQTENVLNTFHLGGEQKILQYCFAGLAVPETYYVGLDARPTVLESDSLSSLVDEPTGNGYTRAGIDSDSFTVEQVGGVYRATTPIIEFTSSPSGNWGPVTNIFLTDSTGNSGVLFGTASLNQSVQLANGDSVLVRFAAALRDFSS